VLLALSPLILVILVFQPLISPTTENVKPVNNGYPDVPLVSVPPNVDHVKKDLP